MNIEEKDLIEAIKQKLTGFEADCNDCKWRYQDDQYGNDPCTNCKVKSTNWLLDEGNAENYAYEILNQLK